MDVLSSTTEMARKSRSTERQIHPRGDRITVDDAWRAEVRAELAKRGWEQEDLAKQIPCSPATVTNLLKSTKDGGSAQSRYVKRIHQIFGWRDTADEGLRFVQRRWPSMTETERDAVRALVDSITSKR